MEKKDRTKGGRLIGLGLVLLLAALLFTVRNRWEDRAAGERAGELLARFEQERFLKEADEAFKRPDIPSPETGTEPVPVSQPKQAGSVQEESPVWGVLKLPAQKRTLPVLKACTKENLKEAPCLYTGEKGRTAIAGHNYRAHFGCLSKMAAGDMVYLTTEDGREQSFQVTEITRTNGAERRQLDEGEWDLTLLTCTLGGKDRILVRCTESEESDKSGGMK